MRLHRLTVTGFGPFRDEQVVDFQALSTTGLFLLTGDTGAGKSSVLDAVAYALYGRVAGSRASATRIRSDHADPERPTRVELELTLRGRRMRVTRSPEWERRKVRGSGTTKQPAKVILQRWVDGQWGLRSNRADEVGHELGELLGMNHQQFCQVVLLPQGDFAQFLRADAETRKRLLERLFGTERFSAVEGWLVERRHERRQALGAVDREVDRTVARLAEVTRAVWRAGDLGQEVPAEVDEEVDGDVAAAADDEDAPAADEPDVLTDWAERRVAAATLAHAAASGELDTVRARRASADQRLEAERSLAARQDRLTSLRARTAALASAAPRVEQARQELNAAGRVGAVAVLLDAVAAATEGAQRTRAHALDELREVRRRTAGIPAAAESVRLIDIAEGRVPGTRPARADRDHARGELPGRTALVLEELDRSLRGEVIRLEPLLDDEARLASLLSDLELADDEVADLEAEVAGHRAWLADLPERTQVLQQRRSALEVLVQAGPAQRSEHQTLGARIEAARACARAADELTAASDRRRAAVDAAQSARARWQDLRERRLAAMAGELAGGLKTGAPCPVCGGTEHPAPADRAREAVADAAREDAALAEGEGAERVRAACEHDHDAAAAALQAATVAAGGDMTAQTLTARRELLAGQIETATAADVELDAAAQVATELGTEASQRRSALDASAGAHGRAWQRASNLREAAVMLRAAIASARGEDPTVVARIARLTTAVEAVHAAREAAGLAASAAADLTGVLGRAERAAVAAGFADLGEVVGARRDEAVVDELAALVQAHDHETVLVANGSAAPDLAGTPLEPRADLAAAELAVEVAAGESELASGRVGRLAADAAAATRLAGQLSEQLRARAPVQLAYATVDGLSRLAEGTNVENRLRMRLSYFVLSARLEQVAAAASERLLRMTDGRFSLVHTDDRAAGNQRSGLGLAVCDAWYGTTRDPATLSGGESFMASLALALGLADVVVAEAGGAFMDTLFVDEGFGSLDDSTLDAVLDVLDELREGGRSVGLVSHVAELRQRVPTQLTVCRGRTGSTLTLSA